MVDSLTRVWLVRHGPTTWNIERRIQGNVETDIRQDRIEEYFDRIGALSLPQPDVIIVSGLKRTEQTAKALIKYNSWTEITIEKNPQLNERKWGIFEGMPIDEARERFENDPKIRKDFPNAKDWDEPDFKVDGGESIAEVANRVQPVFSEVVKKYSGKKILFVLHAGVLVSLGLEFDQITECILLHNGDLAAA